MTEAWQIENGVLIGGGGHLFLAHGAHDVLAFAQGHRKVDPVSFQNFDANIAARRDLAGRIGARYLHVIYPDKHSVLTDLLPLAAFSRLGEMYLEKCPAARESCDYPLEVLRTLAESSFLRTDTHLSDAGNIVVVCALTSRLLGQSTGSSRQRLLDGITKERAHCGDLGGKLSPPRSFTECVLGSDWGAKVVSNRLARNDGIVDIWMSPAAETAGRILVFGDSFGRDMSRFLSVFFREVVFLRTPFVHPDIVDCVRPDILISQNVERYLAFVRPDEERPAFHMYPYLRPETASIAPDREFGEIFSAILNFGRSPYDVFARRAYGTQ